MSFILEALKKSERERLKNKPPKFSDALMENKKPENNKLYFIVILSLVSIIFLLLYFLITPKKIQVSKTNKNSSEFYQDIKLTETTKPEPLNLLSANSINKEQRNIEKDSASNNSNEIMDIEIAKVSHNFYLPDLHIDIHVYSENAAERFVFVNMKKYDEGSFLDEGPLIKAITEEGVILEQNDISFLLPNK